MRFNLGDITAVFTNCLFPEFTERAMNSVLTSYPMFDTIVVDDRCRDSKRYLEKFCLDYGARIIENEERLGTGRSLDKAVRIASTPLILTVDHGIELKRSGIVEILLDRLDNVSNSIAAGRKRSDKACNKAFGPYIDPLFALWDREFVVKHNLSFILTHIRIGDWQVDGCSTAQFLQYRSLKLGGELAFIGHSLLHRYIRHHRTPHTRGGCASPHELIGVSEDYLCPRLRKGDGSLAYDRRIDLEEAKEPDATYQ